MRVLNIADNPLPQEMLAAAAEGTHELLAFLRFIDQEGGRARRGETDIGGRGRGGQELVVGGPTRRAVGRASRPDSLVADQARRGGARRPGDHTERLGLRRPAGLPADPSAVFHRASGLPGGMETSGRARGRHDRAVVSDDPAPRRRRCPRSCRRHPWWPVLTCLIDRPNPVTRAIRAAYRQLPHSGQQNPETLCELRAAIAETAAGTPHCRRWYPDSWLRTREALAETGEQSLTYEDYYRIAEKNWLSPVDARSLAINSHALGHWIHYADEPALAQIVVVRPAWLSVAIAAVLEDREAGESGGLVPHRLFGRIWSRPTADGHDPYSHGQQQLFLRLMERFHLTYRVPELDAGEPVSLVGQLVPSGRPDLGTAWETFRAGGPEAVEICQI